MTDASDTAMGAVLQQYINNHWHPISYFSKALKPAETRYSTFDRELLAVYLQALSVFCRVTQFSYPHRPQATDLFPSYPLSRIEANEISTNPSLGLDLQVMISAQDSDPDITRLRSSQTSLTLEPVPSPMSESTILCDTLTGVV